MKRNIRWVRNRRKVVFISICVVLFFFFMVQEKNNITNLRYEITVLEENLKKEKATEIDLMVEIARLSSPSRIEAKALSYGLVSVKLNEIVSLPDVDVDIIAKEERQREESWGLLASLFERKIEAREK